jgi:[ribosomal protein S5]-alanine N-acetyltransferase
MSCPRHSLHRVPAAAFQAMVNGDVEEASRLAPESLPPLTPFITDFQWQRQLGILALDPEHAPWMPRLLVFEEEGEEEKNDKGPPDGESGSLRDVHGVVARAATIVGFMGIHHKPDERGAIEVGYMTDPDHRRKGHATASLRIMIDLAKQLHQIKLLRGAIRVVGNPISERILLSQGFRQVGEMHKEGRGLFTVYELDV